MPPEKTRRPSAEYKTTCPDVLALNRAAATPSGSDATIASGSANAARQSGVSVQSAVGFSGVLKKIRTSAVPGHAVKMWASSARLARVQGQRGWANMMSNGRPVADPMLNSAGRFGSGVAVFPGVRSKSTTAAKPASTAANQPAAKYHVAAGTLVE